jgi:hypothetical protein
MVFGPSVTKKPHAGVNGLMARVFRNLPAKPPCTYMGGNSPDGDIHDTQSANGV